MPLLSVPRGRDTSIMVNYLPIMLMPPAMSWFTNLAPDSISSWEELKKVFTDNYMARVLDLA